MVAVRSTKLRSGGRFWTTSNRLCVIFKPSDQNPSVCGVVTCIFSGKRKGSSNLFFPEAELGFRLLIPTTKHATLQPAGCCIHSTGTLFSLTCSSFCKPHSTAAYTMMTSQYPHTIFRKSRKRPTSTRYTRAVLASTHAAARRGC